MEDRHPEDNIPDHRVPDILARAAELDRDLTETSSVDALRAVAMDAGISLSSLEAALEEYASKSEGAPAEESSSGKDPRTGTLLSMFLGGFGAHRFYLNDNLGILYLLFIWTLIPSVVGLVEAFFMPERVRAYNSREELIEAVRTHRLAAGGATEPKEESRRPCPMCAEPILPAAKICPYCQSDVTRA